MRLGKGRLRRGKAVLPAFILGALLVIGPASSNAFASTITFNFNSLSDGGNNASVQTYMRGAIQAATGVANGVAVNGAGVEKDYTGDNHVVGPVSGYTVTSLTLGNSDGGVKHSGSWDAYLYNSDAIKIDMLFSLPIYSVSFDYEIFPNGSCANPPSTCSVYPDFTFKADGSTILHSDSLDPEAAGYPGLYTHSPYSGSVNKEKSPQLLAVSSTYTFASGVTHLEFYDWPERIGIDNLVITTDPPVTNQQIPTPEPSSMLLVGAGVIGLFVVRRKK